MSHWMEHLNELQSYDDMLREAEHYRLARLVQSVRRKNIIFMLFGIVLTLVMTACAESSRVPAPNVDDIYWPYGGIDGNFSVSCEENRDLFAYDSNAPLDIQEENSQRNQGLTVSDLTYASPLGGRVPATLVIPDGAGPFAGLLMQHGMGTASRPNARKTLLFEAKAFARLGAIVILIDAPYNRPEPGRFQSLNLTEQDRREQIQYIVDLRRAVDLLLSLPKVDPQRLAFVGHSGGGAIGGLLAGVEHRLKGYVLVVGDGGLVTHVTGPEDFMWWEIKPMGKRQEWINWMWPIEPINYVGCAAPAALLFQNGTLDESVSTADALRYQQAGSEPKTVQWYKANHSLGKEALLDRAEWLKEVIGLASNGSYPRTVEIALLIWVLLTVVSLALLARNLGDARLAPRGARLLWTLTIAFLGPLGLAVYWITYHLPGIAREDATLQSSAWRALGSAIWATTGTMSGGIVLLGLLLYFPGLFPNNLIVILAISFLLPFCIGWLIFASSRWLSRSDTSYLTSFRRPLFVEMISTGLVLTGALPVVILVSNKVLAEWMPFGFDLSCPPLWGMFCLAVLAGALVTYPFHLWMIRRGTIRWGEESVENYAKKFVWYQQVALVLLAIAMMIAVSMLSFQFA